MPGFFRPDLPRWQKATIRRDLRSDSRRAQECIEFLEARCLLNVLGSDVSNITQRTTFLRSFVVSHVNLEVQRDFEDMDKQHSEVLKEMAAFRGQLGNLKTIFHKRFVPKPDPIPGGLTKCFRCKSNEHSVKSCPELRKRRKVAPVLVPVVLNSKSHETPTVVPSVLEKVPIFENASPVEVSLETTVGSLNTVVLVPAAKTDETLIVVELDLENAVVLESVSEADPDRKRVYFDYRHSRWTANSHRRLKRQVEHNENMKWIPLERRDLEHQAVGERWKIEDLEEREQHAANVQREGWQYLEEYAANCQRSLGWPPDEDAV